MGLILPAGTYAMVTGGGAYDSCIAADGTAASVCNHLHLDGNGDFNWWGTDVPVPTPWPTGPNGQIGFIGSHYEAWQRLIPLGLTRHTAQLPSPGLAAGALLARRSTSTTSPSTPRLRVQAGCMIPPDANGGAPYRIAFGINDQPSVGTQAPAQGQLEATVIIAATQEISQMSFGSAAKCAAEPGPLVASVGGGLTGAAGTLSLSPAP